MPIPVEIRDGKKTFTVLENNPAVMTPLTHALGAPSLSTYDIYSLTEPSLLSHIRRPALALLVIIPLTPAWDADRNAEDSHFSSYTGSGPDEPVIWFKQTIGHACGSIGLLHCLINGPAKAYIEKGSLLETLREAAIPLGMKERAQMLYDSQSFETAHQSVAELGDTLPPDAAGGDKLGQHFVAFVKGDDGRLWELEGGRKGPICRGVLEEGEDVLSLKALGMGLGRVIELERRGRGDLRFSAIAIAEGGESV